MKITLRRRIETDSDGTYWVLAGPGGAMSWCVLSGSRSGPIAVHSPVPLWEDHPAVKDCCSPGTPCYVERSYGAGSHLLDEWEKAGRDDEVIWRALADWYRTRLIRRSS